MDEQTTTLITDMSEIELSAVALLFRRMGWRDFRENATSDAEATNMRNGVYRLARSLAAAGYEAS